MRRMRQERFPRPRSSPAGGAVRVCRWVPAKSRKESCRVAIHLFGHYIWNYIEQATEQKEDEQCQ